MKNQKQLSKCCKKPKRINYAEESTNGWLCSGCLMEFIPEEKKEWSMGSQEVEEEPVIPDNYPTQLII